MSETKEMQTIENPSSDFNDAQSYVGVFLLPFK